MDFRNIGQPLGKAADREQSRIKTVDRLLQGSTL
jgi:hypothetical protein